MNDPHVVSVKYRLIESDSLEFKNPPDIEDNTPDFHVYLSSNILTLEPKRHYSSEDEIHPIADAFVRSWEIDAGINYGRYDFRFRFEGSQIIDRQPPLNSRTIHLSDRIHITDEIHIKRTYLAYPSPPQEFRLTSEVKVMWDRYCRYIEKQEPLLSMAYFCLTVLSNNKIRTAVAEKYSIQLDVLNKLGDLTSERGDATVARKLTPKTKPLSSNEVVWVETAIKAIIRHLATAQPARILSMTDLPPLL